MHIEMKKVTSSQIAAVGYEPESSTLAITFKGGGTGSNPKPAATYHYANVTPEMFDALKSAESVGSYFYKHIKPFADKYPYTRQAV